MNYLFVVAHPDDESDAAGGTIHKLVAQGHHVAVAIMVSQAAARRNLSETLSTDEEKAMAVLGVEKVYHADFPNIKMNTVPHLELVQFIEHCIDDFQAETIVTHHPTDTNNDHVMTSGAAQAACRLFQRKQCDYRLRLFMYMETPSATEWSLDSAATASSPTALLKLASRGWMPSSAPWKSTRGSCAPIPTPAPRKPTGAWPLTGEPWPG